MSQSESLRKRTEQHKPKNTKSKKDDKEIAKAAQMTMEYINDRFDMNNNYSNYSLEYHSEILIRDIINFIKRKGIRTEFDKRFDDRKIVPDGGIIYLVDHATNIKFPLVIAEVKQQGTNKDRIKEGKKKQAQGNAIERLGKNLTGIKSMMHYEGITPFVCFGSGCDFSEDALTVLVKVFVLNEFYDLNKIYVMKRDGNSEHGAFSPTSMYFRENPWTENEIYLIMREIAETSFRYYLM